MAWLILADFAAATPASAAAAAAANSSVCWNAAARQAAAVATAAAAIVPHAECTIWTLPWSVGAAPSTDFAPPPLVSISSPPAPPVLLHSLTARRGCGTTRIGGLRWRALAPPALDVDLEAEPDADEELELEELELEELEVEELEEACSIAAAAAAVPAVPAVRVASATAVVPLPDLTAAGPGPGPPATVVVVVLDR